MLTPLGRTGVKHRKEDFVCFLFFFNFFLGEFHVCFDHIHTTPQVLQITPAFVPIQICVL